MITEAKVRAARLYPELLPDTRIATVAAGSELSPPILNLRRFSPVFLELVNIAVKRSDMEVRVRADSLRQETKATALPDQVPAPWNLIATDLLELNLYSAAGVTSIPVSYALWVYQPTVAHKLKHQKQLTEEERALDAELGIKKSVDKGVLPLPLSYTVEREYQVLSEVTRSVVANINTTMQVVDFIEAMPDEVLVLTEIATAPGNASDNIRIIIDRDTDANYLELDAFAMSLDRGLPAFVPALYEIRIKAVANTTVSNHPIRYSIKRCRLTNILRARWGLPPREGTPADAWNEVLKRTRGGVL